MKNRIQLIILLGLFTLLTRLHAQTCTTPITVAVNGAWQGVDSFNVAERWLQFYAENDDYELLFYVKNYSGSNHLIEVFQNNCSTLTPVFNSLNSSSDTAKLGVFNLITGNQYLIRLSNITAPNYEVYNLSISVPTNSILISSCTNTSCGYSADCGELVCNGGFECRLWTPGGVMGISQGICPSWGHASNGTSDYYSSINVNPLVGVPCNWCGLQAGHNNSNSYAGFIPETESLQTKLISPLTANNTYIISFYVSRGENTTNLIKELSVFTSTSQVYFPNPNMPIPLTPIVSITNTTVLNNNTSWERISFCYTPSQSGEQFLIIGSSNTFSPTYYAPITYTNCALGFTPWPLTYIYVDDVSVKPVLQSMNIINQPICSNVPLSYNAATSCTLNDTYNFTWSPSAGLSSSTVPNPTITLTSSTVYSVTLNFTTTSGQACSQISTLAINVTSACCSQTHLPVFSGSVLPSTSLGTAMIINNDVVLPAGQSGGFSTTEFLFAPNVKVTVSNGATLRIRGAHLYACAGARWQGIVVQDGGRVETLKPTNLIEDAEIAIDVSNHNTSTLTISSPILDISTTVFNKNYIGIKIANYTRTVTTYPFNIRENVFTSRNFTFTPTSWPNDNVTNGLRSAPNGSTALSSPYTMSAVTQANILPPLLLGTQPSSIGILVENVGTTNNSGQNTTFKGIQIGDPTLWYNFNLFDNLCVGIYSRNSNVYSFNNVFQNSHKLSGFKGTHLSGIGIRSEVVSGSGLNPLLNTILNLNPNSNTNYNLSNRFWNCQNALSIFSTFSLNCSYVIFRSIQTTTNMNNVFSVGYTGINAQTNRYSGYTISNCNFNNIRVPVNISFFSGQYSVNSSTLNGIYSGNMSIQNNFMGAALNTTSSIGTGYMKHAIYITGQGITPSNSGNTGIYIAGNNMDRVFNGVYITGTKMNMTHIVNNTINLIDENVVFANQRGIDASNCSFISAINNTLNAASTTNTRVILVFNSSNTAPRVTCNLLSNSYKGFEFHSANQSTIWRGNQMQTHARGMVLSQNGIISPQGSSGNPIDNKWLGSWTGTNYGTFTADNLTFASNSPLFVKTGTWTPPNNSGVPNMQSYNSGSWFNITTGTYTCPGGGGGGGQGVNLPNNLVIPVNDSTNTDDTKCIEINALYRLLVDNDSIKDSDDAYSDFYDELAGSTLNSFVEIENHFANGDISSGLSINSAITPTNTVEENYITLYTLLGAYLEGDFESADSTELINLALLCPGLNGTAVYLARALYNQIYWQADDYIDECLESEGSGERRFNAQLSSTSENQKINSWSVDFFPNPASNSLTIISRNKTENLHLSVYDLNGRIVLQSDLVTVDFISNFGLNLIPGFYTVIVKNTLNETTNKKLIIAK